MYSASVDDRDTDFWREDLHEMIFRPRYTSYAVVERPPFVTPPQSESENAVRSMEEFFPLKFSPERIYFIKGNQNCCIFFVPSNRC
ncbi:unnamed protein product [Lactuca virosa]|uniref:Uncharacterized protein n=1 Tax=Lactuca virosa TaxID=75947 RepID=A0AAU9MC77_9ASTR|nr:unnamed protein product [Lactuca virosa]